MRFRDIATCKRRQEPIHIVSLVAGDTDCVAACDDNVCAVLDGLPRLSGLCVHFSE